jgi:tetratricopeptide (TPR) repeat protein
MRQGGLGIAGFGTAALLVVLVWRSTLAGGDPTADTSACSIAAGHDAQNNTVTCNFGLTQEQLRQITTAAVDGATEPLLKEFKEVSKQLGVTEEAAKTLLKIVGEQTDVPDERLAEVLTRVANDYSRLKAQTSGLSPDNPIARTLVTEAKAEIDAGHLEHAHELLHQATQAQIAAAQEASKLLEQAQASRDAQMLGAANSTAAEGDVALTESHYLQAALLFGQAASYVPTGHPDERSGFLERQGYALGRQGDERGDNAALSSAIEVYRAALKERPRDRVPFDWARTQSLLGDTLGQLGYRETGTAKLEAAVFSLEEALKEQDRAQVPLDWALTQFHLGNVLRILGERQGKSTQFERAVIAFRAALLEQTQERVPLVWARTETALGLTLLDLGSGNGDTTNFEQAIIAFNEALKQQTFQREPSAWAETQNGLGSALYRLGGGDNYDDARLEAAADALRAATQGWTREKAPLNWAAVQVNLGNVLSVIGSRDADTLKLEEAIDAYGKALEEITRERSPVDWAKAYGNQGVAKKSLADLRNDVGLAEAAYLQIDAALAVTTITSDTNFDAKYYFEQSNDAKLLYYKLRSSSPQRLISR